MARTSYKYFLLALPCILMLSSFHHEDEVYGETIITRRGDELTFSKPKEREVVVGKSKTRRTVTTEEPVPVLLNGKKIYHFKRGDSEWLVWTEAYKNATREFYLLRDMIDSAIGKEVENLQPGDCQYEMSNMVVDERGYITYYETEGIERYVPAPNPFTKPATFPVNPTSAYIINGIIARLANKMRYTPLIINGELSAYLTGFNYSCRKKE